MTRCVYVCLTALFKKSLIPPVLRHVLLRLLYVQFDYSSYKQHSSSYSYRSYSLAIKLADLSLDKRSQIHTLDPLLEPEHDSRKCRLGRRPNENDIGHFLVDIVRVELDVGPAHRGLSQQLV